MVTSDYDSVDKKALSQTIIVHGGTTGTLFCHNIIYNSRLHSKPSCDYCDTCTGVQLHKNDVFGNKCGKITVIFQWFLQKYTDFSTKLGLPYMEVLVSQYLWHRGRDFSMVFRGWHEYAQRGCAKYIFATQRKQL